MSVIFAIPRPMRLHELEFNKNQTEGRIQEWIFDNETSDKAEEIIDKIKNVKCPKCGQICDLIGSKYVSNDLQIKYWCWGFHYKGEYCGGSFYGYLKEAIRGEHTLQEIKEAKELEKQHLQAAN